METDVRFLLVHHTAEPGNDYGPGDAPALLRGMYDYHTSSAKGWPDIAYNFLIDQFGVVYEGRSGSLIQASIPDATGGSQGFSQLACFIGNLDVQAPTAAARESMDRVLAYLADRHAVDITPGATTDFVSRGSNRYPPGVEVHTKTVAGHRDMSATTCPGAFAYAMVEDNSFAARASVIRQEAAITPTPSPASTGVEPPSRDTAPANGEEAAVTSAEAGHTSPEAGSDSDGSSLPWLAAGGALTLGAAAAVPLLRRRSRQQDAAQTIGDSTVTLATPGEGAEPARPSAPSE
ncbi:MAG: N-acetylmuramoyl-L-alanine amidase [Nocardioides sp.]